jgi:hypothetical protein
MSTAGGPKLHGIGRSGDSDIVLCMDAHDAESYPGEPTTNLFPQPSLADSAVGSTWSGSNGTWGTSTATVESVMGPDGKYIKAVSNQHTASGGGTAHIWFFYNYLSGMGSAQRDLTLTNGTTYTCSWWWKANEAKQHSSANQIYFVGLANVSTSGSLNPVSPEWSKASITFTFGGTTGTYNPGHYFYNVGDSTAVGFKVWYAMLQIEEKTYATPAVRSQLSGFGQQGYNARPASTNLMIHGNVGTGQSFSDSSPSKHTITTVGNTTHSSESKFSGGSIAFDGTVNDYLGVADSTDWEFSNQPFTIDFWGKNNSTTASRGIISIASSSQSNYENILVYTASSATTLVLYSSSGGTIWDIASGAAMGAFGSDWTHYAIVRESVAGDIKLYNNGTLIDVVSTSATLRAVDTFRIGQRVSESNSASCYLDEIRITKGTALWGSAFTPPTRRNRNAPVVDLSGSDNGGNFATKDMTDVATYRDGQVIEPVASAVWDFDNTDDVITLGPSSGFGITNTVSVFAWVKLDSTSGWNGVFGTYSGGSFIHFQLSSGGMNVYLYGPNAAYGTIDSECYISAGEWAHIGFAYGSTVLTVYVNGEAMPTKPTGSSANVTSVTEVSIGRVYDSGRMFNGQIGNVQVYRAALTDQQVKQNFNSQRSRFKV